MCRKNRKCWQVVGWLGMCLLCLSFIACGGPSASEPPPVAPNTWSGNGGGETDDGEARKQPPPSNAVDGGSQTPKPGEPNTGSQTPGGGTGSTPDPAPPPSDNTDRSGNLTACGEPIQPGTCKNLGVTRYAWDASKGHCVAFSYHCNGNSNNFETMAECRKSCPATNGACFEGDRSYSNSQSFAKDCNTCTCKDGKLSCTKIKCPAKKPEYCSLAPASGPCKANFQRWHFDAKSGTCKPFAYGGCDGNDNNFESESECLQTCGN